MQLYVDSFPAEERRPIEQMPPDDSAFHLYAIESYGLITTWQFPDFTLIEHFAIHPHLRKQGIGSEVLTALTGNLILEVEPAETSPLAARRIKFYQRNGFKLLNVPYMQPPYAPGLPEVELRLMVRGEIANIEQAINLIHRRVYGASN